MHVQDDLRHSFAMLAHIMHIVNLDWIMIDGYMKDIVSLHHPVSGGT